MTQSTKAILLLILVAIVLTISIALLSQHSSRTSLQSNEVTSQLPVITSFYPLWYFTTQIGGDLVTAENITPAGSEPHDYEPTPQQMVLIENSPILILNGGGFEPWGERVSQQLDTSQVDIIRTTDHIPAAQTNPHVWLSPRLAQGQVKSITRALIQADPAHANEYQRNEGQLIQELQALDQEFASGLRQCQQRVFITSHDAFGPLAEAYGLEPVSIAGLSPDEEPSSRTLAQLSQYIRNNNIRYVFFETLVSPKLSQTLAQETGAQTLVLDPLEGLSQNQIDDGETYFTVMRQNLANLRLALGCQ